jgi:hypothetical protein
LADPGPAGQDRFVTEARSPLDAALDLLIYAPVGFALTAAEEIPKLAAKGRAQVGGQVAMAKVVGQFAVAQGRKELARRFSAGGEAAAGADRPVGPRPSGPDAGRPPANSHAGPEPGSGEIDFDDLLARSEEEDQSADAGGDPGGVGAGPAASAEEPPASPGGLGIPGYDTLAASQVVQRLAGLSAEELAAVGVYESAHRARRTILTRVDQLRTAVSPPAPDESS